MAPIVRALLAFVVSLLRSRVSLQMELLALQHQLAVYRRSIRRPPVRPSDRIVWSWLSRGWARWREVVVFVQPATVLAWRRTRSRAGARGTPRRRSRPALGTAGTVPEWNRGSPLPPADAGDSRYPQPCSSWRECISPGDLGSMQPGIRIGGEGSEERLPATLMPMERPIQSATARQWKVIGTG
jgi:hypothetical protein